MIYENEKQYCFFFFFLFLEKILPLPMYGSLPNNDQLKVFQRSHDARKIVVATNIAETSITIPNITYGK